MGHAAGLRAGTRYAFSRDFKKKGMIPLSTYLKTYKVGDIVDVVANGAVQKGMPYKVYHGKTGIVYNVTKSAVGVILQKQVGNRYMEKRINVRIEHVRHSRSREDFLKRLKRIPVQPRGARTISLADNKPENITPVPYETTI
ncbi:similar to 60s ribosomal protein l21 [Plenodomus lingam JN3]|uniref:Similar to 60s ribosomal protein l21 n=1 Tax=Leptosphaeria maculans (strain JN3 / isolate v23.1.3 / race Av1-4-5-6-7-8) TaxID=985895 RepID=E4ZTD6_LEPMJ|nr:similar to 60s ribosomal protein l21 [Plenodomus lingam JN3]CBX94792.1 similar to 60s ribosomal protein l21 [Plenodomus lingam JN3]